MEEFRKESHKYGRLTVGFGILICILFPLYLSFIEGYHPGFTLILTSLFSYASIIGIVWFLEPIMYFPVLGVPGTYIAFYSGNISNMCLPAAAASQDAVGVKPGTDKGEIVATLGISMASLVNKIILIPIILTGLWILTIIPESVQNIFPFVLPAIFGAVLAQFAAKFPLYGVFALLLGLIVNAAPIPLFMKNVTCVIVVILVMVIMKRNKNSTVSR